MGDSLTADVRGANALGIPVAWVNRRPRPPHSIPACTTKPPTWSPLRSS
ncbi:hypothetical protein [Kribbella sp. NBC_01484]